MARQARDSLTDPRQAIRLKPRPAYIRATRCSSLSRRLRAPPPSCRELGLRVENPEAELLLLRYELQAKRVTAVSRIRGTRRTQKDTRGHERLSD